MLILAIVLVVACYAGWLKVSKYEKAKRGGEDYAYLYEDGYASLFAMMAAIFGLFAIGIIIGIFVGIHGEMTADDNIAILEDVIAESEEEIGRTVEYYIAAENLTLSDITPGDSATAVALALPELGSKELVAKQIENIQNNRNQLLEKRQAKIGNRMWRFWLYFGRP